MSNCLICNNLVSLLFQTKVLQKHLVNYYQCTHCGFIQTDTPFWLDEAYQNAITSPDVGLVSRNLLLADETEKLILNFFDYKARFIDYAGGYGLLVRLMRDKGFNFYRQDIFCENIFARHIDVINLPANTIFELATAFEVFEHWAYPGTELEKILQYTDSVFFSTQIQPAKKFRSPEDWWYFIPETGQHIAFYTLRSLEILGNKYNKQLYSNGKNLHLFTSKKFKKNPFTDSNKAHTKQPFIKNVLSKALRFLKISTPHKPPVKLESLTQKDFSDEIKRLSESHL